MSLKRLPSVGHFNGHSNHNSPTATTTATTKTAIAATTMSMSFAAVSAFNQNSGDSYFQIGGLGLLHQQNLRSGANGVIGGGIGGGAPVMGGNGGSPGGPNNINGNVNVLLGCAMLSVVTTVLCVVCYCCHRNIRKRTEAAYRQRWMDNDANMEIYSVEQCYETSGLFMESSEGLAVPALTHEPPPSYDAVVAIQEDTQATRISPPPDYRSMNDVSGPSNPGEIPKFIRENYFLGMQHKRLSAHSCCSLQRAEAENRYHMGVAAVVPAAASGRFCMSALGRKSLLYTTAREGRPVNQPYYRGCPLCGKFRHDDSMSLSSDSGLDQVVLAVDVSNGNTADKNACYCTPLQSPIADDRNNNADDHESHFALAIDDRRSVSSIQAVDAANCENAINNNVEGDNNTPTTGAASTSTSAPCSSATAANALASDNHCATDDATLDLDSINDNGLIRLDMSKIIDKTGLPTYEAALKLESSGYV